MAPVWKTSKGGWRGTHCVQRLKRLLSILQVMQLVFCSVAWANAETLSEQQIKAGFLFNFTRFVEWPPRAFSASGAQFVICIVEKPAIFNVLTDTVNGLAVDSRSISVRQIKWSDDARGCNLIFLARTAEGHVARVLQSVRGNSTLTVGEDPGFLQEGGMFNFVVEENRVRLELNLDAATGEGLKVSAKLIAVSRLIPNNSTPGGH